MGTVAEERLRTVLAKLSGMPVGLDRVLLELGRLRLPTDGNESVIGGDVLRSALGADIEIDMVADMPGLPVSTGIDKLREGVVLTSGPEIEAVVKSSGDGLVRAVSVRLGNDADRDVEGTLKVAPVSTLVEGRDGCETDVSPEIDGTDTEGVLRVPAVLRSVERLGGVTPGVLTESGVSRLVNEVREIDGTPERLIEIELTVKDGNPVVENEVGRRSVMIVSGLETE